MTVRYLTFEDKRCAPVCSAIIGIKAVALGCGSQIVEDTTQLNFTGAVDGDRPLVTCDLGTQGTFSHIHTEHCVSSRSLSLTQPMFTCSLFTDLGCNNCTNTEDLAVNIEVLSNEIVAVARR